MNLDTDDKDAQPLMSTTKDKGNVFSSLLKDDTPIHFSILSMHNYIVALYNLHLDNLCCMWPIFGLHPTCYK